MNHSERALGGLKRRFEYELLYGKMNIDIKPKDGWLPKTPSGLLALIDSLEEVEEEVIKSTDKGEDGNESK